MSTLHAPLQEARSPHDDIFTRIDRGAARLDHLCLNWIDQIDLARLDMESRESCVLAQLYGSYASGLAAVGIQYANESLRLGFNAEGHSEYGDLATCWRTYIQARRKRWH